MHRHLAVVVTTVCAGGTLFTCHRLECQRRPLSSCTALTVPGAIASLQKSGVAVVSGLRLDPNLVSATISMPAAESMPTKNRKPKRRGVPQSKQEQEEEKTWRLSALGRYHCRDEERFDSIDMQVLEQVEKQIRPLVDEFFRLEEEGEIGRGAKEGWSEATAIQRPLLLYLAAL